MTCATCKHHENGGPTGVLCAYQPPYAMLTLLADFMDLGPDRKAPPSQVHPNWSCSAYDEEDFDPIDAGDVL